MEIAEKKLSGKVFWVPHEAGGRVHLPAGLKYSTIARWPNQTDEDWKREGWSIVLDFDESPAKQGSPSIAKVSFLSESGPKEWLKPGCTFELYEGPHKVADVEIG